MKRPQPADTPDADPFLAERLAALETLIAAHPASPEAITARRLVARARHHLQRGLRAATRRHLLAAVRSATVALGKENL